MVRKPGRPDTHRADADADADADAAEAGDAAYRQYVRNKIARGLADIRAGRVVSHEEAVARLYSRVFRVTRSGDDTPDPLS